MQFSIKLKTRLLALVLALLPAMLPAQNLQVRGVVTDDEGPLIGASVVIKGTTTGTATDMDGHYSISVPSSGAVLVFSCVGYKTEERTVGNSRDIDVRLNIDDNLLEGDKIAIELTESRSEADFMVVKEKIEELRGRGIKFYLDDFGTGYSNMERIMELPFDIIKFDRSLVLASGADERSEKIVENLANMFRDMNYSVLYEGVEDESDEARCRGMSASYLQGYKYSRPVPIERLREFLPKISD